MLRFSGMICIGCIVLFTLVGCTVPAPQLQREVDEGTITETATETLIELPEHFTVTLALTDTEGTTSIGSTTGTQDAPTQDSSMKLAPFCTYDGASASERCLERSYWDAPEYKYTRGSGQHTEVWLCCVPVGELLRKSFCCEKVVVPPIHSSDPEYAKIRYCYVRNPISTDLQLIPVCILASQTAPDLDRELE
jgi:hypothetical protein